MNVMAQAHKAAKEFFASVTQTGLSYAKVLQIKLRVMHRQYKEECKNSPVDWYSVEGHVICEETGTYIPFYEGTSKASVAAANVLWYVQNFDKHYVKVVASRENGSVFVEKAKTNYK
jgi:hypothetical protein